MSPNAILIYLSFYAYFRYRLQDYNNLAGWETCKITALVGINKYMCLDWKHTYICDINTITSYCSLSKIAVSVSVEKEEQVTNKNKHVK